MKLLNILVFLIVIVNLVYLGYFTSTITGSVVVNNIEYGNLTHVVDGDTIDVFIFSKNITQRCRLLGINNKSV